MDRLVYGVGINDASGQAGALNGQFYKRWQHMLERCYSAKYQERKPTYLGCSVDSEWLYFSRFKEWMANQDWQGKHLDKDILHPGNKVYGPQQCVFVDVRTNTFLNENNKKRGKWPIGVHQHRKTLFQANINNPFTKTREFLGRFSCPHEAHEAWFVRKCELAVLLAETQTDSRIAEAIIRRYSKQSTGVQGGRDE